MDRASCFLGHDLNRCSCEVILELTGTTGWIPGDRGQYVHELRKTVDIFVRVSIVGHLTVLVIELMGSDGQGVTEVFPVLALEKALQISVIAYQRGPRLASPQIDKRVRYPEIGTSTRKIARPS